MGSIRVSTETDKMFFDFKFKNVRCREQTTLDDNKANRSKLQKVMDKIDAEITLDQFVYRNYFPNSTLAEKFDQLEAQQCQVSSGSTPKFKQFAQEWYDEIEVGWRHSHKITVLRLMNGRIMDWFEEMDVSLITKADILKFRASLAKVERKDGKTFPQNIPIST